MKIDLRELSYRTLTLNHNSISSCFILLRKKDLCLIKLSRERRQNLPHFWIMKRQIVFCFVFHLEQVWILFVTVDALATVNIHGRWYRYSIGQHSLLKVQSYTRKKKHVFEFSYSKNMTYFEAFR